jgi:ParB-like chromosome segregation protein Spo0J
MVVLAFGYSPNMLAAALVEDRLILMNGSHRAYALRDAGVTHAPCLIQEVSRRDELDVLGVDDLQSRPDAFLAAPRPPLLRDYFDPALRITAGVQRKNRHVQVGFNVAALDLPA